MTGQELINWIKANKAEELPVAVQYRDGGGEYYGGELISSPILANICGNGVSYDGVDITYDELFPQNAIVL